MLPFLVSLTAVRQSRVKCPLQANLILVDGRVVFCCAYNVTNYESSCQREQPYLAVGR